LSVFGKKFVSHRETQRTLGCYSQH